MKHHHFLYRTLSALLCLGLCAQLTACGKKPVPKPGSSGPSAPSVSKKVYDDSLITEVYDEEDSFTDEYGTEYSYICHVPQLEADTPEAKAINWEIMESFGNDVQATLDAAESGETPNSQYMEVTWQSYWNDSLLSLSIRVLGWTSDLIDYAVYHYDFETGQRPDNLELLDRFHVDEGDFTAALRRGAARQFDSHYAPWGMGGLSPEDENYGGISIDLAALRAWTAAAENFSLDLARFCPNGDGTFTAFQPVASIAGGNGWYYEPVLVEPGPGDWADGGPQTEDAFVSAWLTDDGVSVSFTKSQSRDFPDSETYRRAYGFAYDTEYPVAGCYGDYQDIFVSASGQDFCPYVFLLTTDGTVEYIASAVSGMDASAPAARSTVSGTSWALSPVSMRTASAAATRPCTPWTKTAGNTICPPASRRRGTPYPATPPESGAPMCITAWPAVPPMRASTI